MARITETAGDIVKAGRKHGDSNLQIYCKFCDAHVERDPPDTLWFGYDGPGPNRLIDGHERCDPIAKAMEAPAFDGELAALFERLSIPEGEHELARLVLLWRIKRDL